jgi:putative tryptophan/tyrosine transport system substrate-binding protein
MKVSALNVRGAPLFISNRDWIAQFAIRNKLPTMSEERIFADAGALLSYGPIERLLTERLAAIIDKVLNGARPGDIPIEQPTKFELLLNEKTAKALSLDIPPSLRRRIDELIG